MDVQAKPPHYYWVVRFLRTRSEISTSRKRASREFMIPLLSAASILGLSVFSLVRASADFFRAKSTPAAQAAQAA